jgi:hypothetical protein
VSRRPRFTLSGWPSDPEFDARRASANAELLSILADYLGRHPGLRFGQALANLGVTDTERLVHEEPGVTLARVRERL